MALHTVREVAPKTALQGLVHTILLGLDEAAHQLPVHLCIGLTSEAEGRGEALLLMRVMTASPKGCAGAMDGVPAAPTS
eukprot:1161112-Pelagomonas_calceolata.AAC.13